MGNLTSHPFVSDDVDWNAYVAAEWRSLRARELDRLGGANAAGAAGPPPPSALQAPHYTQHKCAACFAGLTRPALAAGQSFSRKLDYLGVRACMYSQRLQRRLQGAHAARGSRLQQADGVPRCLLHAQANVLEQATEIQSMFGSVRPTDSDIPTIAIEKRRFKR